MKEVLKIGAITIVKEAKKIHQNDIMLVKIGGFYRTYGRDAYILSNLFGYKTKKENEIITCGFPIKSIAKIISKLENKKINYMILDSRDNYNIEEKMDFKNLNTYDKQYQTSKIYVNNQRRIDNICDYLSKNSKKENLKYLLKEVEELIYAKGKI